MIVSILDGYIDEPSSLGVPPFISPLVRYIAGAMLDAGHDVGYRTIDQHRSSTAVRKELAKADLLVIVAGLSVPGKYIRGTPASAREVAKIAKGFGGPSILAGFMGLALDRKGKGKSRKGTEDAYDLVLKGDPDAQLFDFVTGGMCSVPETRKRTAHEWNRWSTLGASVVEQHPDFPQPLIAEVDVYKGCVRMHTGGCSFCSEVLLGPPRFREPAEVASEVHALSRAGVTNFRLACSCIMSYKAKGLGSRRIVPSPPDIGRLMASVVGAARGLRVLHVDNADPGVIARHPSESRRVLRTLVDYCTSGNILSLGMESADPKVIEKNNLNSDPELVMEAIQLINDLGGERGPTGMHRLLPGLNFIAGLEGETSTTYRRNLGFLKKVDKQGLLLRRINIRQVLEVRRRFPGVKKRKDFMRFKTAVREGIDRPMLERLLPTGTVLRDLYIEKKEGKVNFARQVGTYPILVGIPAPVKAKGFFDGAIVGWGQRSVTAVPYPVDLNTASLDLMTALPGIGKKRAARLARARPFKSTEDIENALDSSELMESMRPFIDIGK
jgi:radical SAM superfamily enzyme with C-terminal helix-hairpin-helix motif